MMCLFDMAIKAGRKKPCNVTSVITRKIPTMLNITNPMCPVIVSGNIIHHNTLSVFNILNMIDPLPDPLCIF